MTKLTWRNEKRRLGDLIPWKNNARRISDVNAQRLVQSLEEFGQVEMLAIEPDNELIDGHQRQYCWSAAAEFGPDYEVEVRVASRKLTEREKRKLSVFLHRGAQGEWDWDLLIGWNANEDLLSWGFETWEFGVDKTINDETINYDDLWEGMPAFEQEEQSPFQTVLVHFRNENDVADFAALIEQTVTQQTKYIWYPKQERTDLKRFACVDEESI